MQYAPHKILIDRNIRPESTGIPVLSFHCQRLTKASVICPVMLDWGFLRSPIRFLGWGYGVESDELQYQSSARGCRLIFGFFDSRKGIVSPAGGLSRRKELPHGIENDRWQRENPSRTASFTTLPFVTKPPLAVRERPCNEERWSDLRCRQGYQILCVWRRFARVLVFWCFVLPVCLTSWLSVRRWARASKTKR